jgi:hypothetical protein
MERTTNKRISPVVVDVHPVENVVQEQRTNMANTGHDQHHGSDAQPGSDRGYDAYNSGGELEFCPLKDLNLPASYAEVVSRFKRLQGDRDAEVMN